MYTQTISSGLGVGSFSLESCELCSSLGNSKSRLRAKVGSQHVLQEENTLGPERSGSHGQGSKLLAPGAVAATGVNSAVSFPVAKAFLFVSEKW